MPLTTAHGVPAARVLLVGQDRANRRLARVYLELAGAEVFATASVRDALSCIREIDIDAVLTSCRMPDGGGCTLLAELHDRVPHARLPVIAVTGLPWSRTEAIALGFDGIVNKPYDCVSLIGELQRVLLFR